MTKRHYEVTPDQYAEALQAEGLLVQYRSSQSSQTFDSIATDSRTAGPGSLFIAYQGVNKDLHEFIPQALANGTNAFVIENGNVPPESKLPMFVVESGRAAWAVAASLMNGVPQKKLRLCAVTGTNGKSSTVWLLREILRACGHEALSIGTLGAYLGDEKLPTTHTTPDPPELFRLFRRAVDAQVPFVVMETSSHAMAQRKLTGVQFETAAFTSFSQDHLDLHKTMDAYWQAKWELFSKHLVSNQSRTVFCHSLSERMPQHPPSNDSWVYRLGAEATLSGYKPLALKVVERRQVHTVLRLTRDGETLEGEVPFFATFYLENFAAALLCAEKLIGHLPEPPLWKTLSQVPGRMQRVGADSAECPLIFVDYAHTPDALQRALETLRPITIGRLIVVFGCGGDRDKGKRPLMGEVAARLADAVVLTTDNPRSEAPSAILKDIASGLPAGAVCTIDENRESAIHTAILNSRINDTILIAGKGHENYQIIGTKILDFDDCEVARSALAEWR